MVFDVIGIFVFIIGSVGEFVEDGFVGFVDDVGENVEMIMMGYINDNVFDVIIDVVVN